METFDQQASNALDKTEDDGRCWMAIIAKLDPASASLYFLACGRAVLGGSTALSPRDRGKSKKIEGMATLLFFPLSKTWMLTQSEPRFANKICRLAVWFHLPIVPSDSMCYFFWCGKEFLDGCPSRGKTAVNRPLFYERQGRTPVFLFLFFPIYYLGPTNFPSSLPFVADINHWVT